MHEDFLGGIPMSRHLDRLEQNFNYTYLIRIHMYDMSITLVTWNSDRSFLTGLLCHKLFAVVRITGYLYKPCTDVLPDGVAVPSYDMTTADDAANGLYLRACRVGRSFSPVPPDRSRSSPGILTLSKAAQVKFPSAQGPERGATVLIVAVLTIDMCFNVPESWGFPRLEDRLPSSRTTFPRLCVVF